MILDSEIYEYIKGEIAHFVLDHNSTINISEEQKEAEVKFFAKYIEAPPPLIHQMSVVSKENIRNIFGLSDEAANYSLNYYLKWLMQFNGIYKSYELLILKFGGLKENYI